MELIKIGKSNGQPYRMANPTSIAIKLTIPTYEGSGQLVHPSVVHIPQGFGPTGEKYIYWMAFTPYPNSDGTKENPSIVASNDGITWVVPTGLTNPIADYPGVPGYYADPSLVYDGTQLICYWSHSGIETPTTLRKTSSDGVTWSDAVDIGKYLAGSYVLFLTEGTHARFVAWNKGGEKGYLSRYESVDGLTWSGEYRVPTNIEGGGGHVTVFNDAAGFHFLWSLSPVGAKTGTKYGLYYGFSKDGSSVLFDIEPIFMPDRNISWADANIYTSCMIPFTDNSYIVYTSAINKNSESALGFFIMRLGEIQSRVIPTGSKATQKKTVILCDNLEVRSAAVYPPLLYSGRIPEFNDYPNKTITLFNSHDQSINLVFNADFSGTVTPIEFNAAKTEQKISITASTRVRVLTSADIALLGTMFDGHVRFAISPTTAETPPTTGAIKAVITMWA